MGERRLNVKMTTDVGLVTRIFPDRQTMGKMAAGDIAAELRLRLRVQPTVRIVFASAPSQKDMLDALRGEPDIDWSRVTAFHMDEYIGLPAGARERFAVWLRSNFFDHLPLGEVHVMEPDDGPEKCAANYARLLATAPLDVVCLGIGVNGHIAFNDPAVADFHDREAVKIVELDDECRQQQVLDDCFSNVEAVPLRAITLTVPRLLDSVRMFCVVPGRLKKDAVRRTLRGPIETGCPATALRLHPRCALYLDMESAESL
jgi:glucosamine-6-phosphate deaminase